MYEEFPVSSLGILFQHLIEFIYCGKVTIPGERLKHVCTAAHELGVYGLVDFLPVNLNTVTIRFLDTQIQVNRSKHSINETQVMEQFIFSFGIKEQLVVMLQNVNDINK